MKRTAISIAGLAFLTLFFPSPASPVTPMSSYISLVAGEGDAGFRDGEFCSALFNQPEALALDVDGNLLFVADRQNHCVRTVDFNDSNRVGTMAGTGQKGRADGGFKSASFNLPSLIAFVSPHRLVVYDSGNDLFRLLDLDQKKVSTLRLPSPGGKFHKGWEGVYGMAYIEKEKRLYFSVPDVGALMRLDLATMDLEKIRLDDRLPHPAALGVYQGSLCVADRTLPTVYRLDSLQNGPQAEPAAILSEVGQGSTVVSLAASGDKLYAVQEGSYPWWQIAPSPGPVKIMSVWGDFLESGTQELSQLFNLKCDCAPAAGFISDPAKPGFFYLSLPPLNGIISLRDCEIDKNKDSEDVNDNGLMDFSYPAAKSAHTFRVLELGESRLFYESEAERKTRWPWGFNRMETSPKREELLLNTLASLYGEETHYEVLHSGAKGFIPTYLRVYYAAPELIRKFDVDLALVFVTVDFRINFHMERPYGEENLPLFDLDPVFLLKPLAQRLREDHDDALSDFYRRCVNHRIVKPGEEVTADLPGMVVDPQARQDLVEIAARPLKLLVSKVQGMRTKDGRPVALGLVFFPGADRGGADVLPIETYRSFYRDVCKEAGIPFHDMTDGMVATRLSFYPMAEPFAYRHFDHNGNTYFAYMVVQELLKEKLIPLGQKNTNP